MNQLATTSPLRVVFMGSPDFAVPSLRALHREHQVVLAVTQPDRPRGRGRAMAPPPVKVVAEQLGIDVMQPERLRKRAVREAIMGHEPDVIVVAAYGQILSPRLLAGPRLGCINVHASLLPGYRGAAPIQWAVLDGVERSGVTIMQMAAGLDTGPVLLQQAIDLERGETAGSLHDKLAVLGAPLLLDALAGVAAGRIEPRPQDDARASYAPMLEKSQGRVDFAWPADRVDRWIRGMDPWPGAFTEVDGERLKLYGARRGEGRGRAGAVLTCDDRGLLVACGDDEAVWIVDLQLPGRRRMPACKLLAGRPIPDGTILG